MNLDFSPYAVGGAAARADSFTRLDPNFATGVHGLTQAAHAAGIPLQITSAYRSPELQAQLYASALERYGSPEAARRWVAPPGRSQHNYGTAVDFALNGSLIRDADSPAAQFIRNNADQYGLSVPMDWEPWQVEPVGSRDGSRPQAAMTTRNATALSPGAALNFRGAPQMAMQSTQPQGLLGQLGIQRQDPTAQGETALPFYQRDRFGNTMGNLAMAFNSLRQRPDENIPRIVTGQRAAREQDVANNRTVEWLSSQPGGERFAGLVESVGAAGALQAYQAEVARTSQPPSAAEAQIARLVASGLPYETAVGIADGRLVQSRDPVTGEAVVLDLAQQFLTPGAAAAPADAATPTAPAGQFDEYDRDTLQRALGLGGAVRTVWNRASEGFGAELPRATVDEARGNLQSLSTRTMLGLSAEFPGRPSNLTREEIRGLTVQADELFSGAGSAEQKAQNLFDFTNEAVTAAQAVLESRVSPAEKVQARAALEYLVPLQQDYQSLLSALGRDNSTPAAGLDAALDRYPGAGQ